MTQIISFRDIPVLRVLKAALEAKPALTQVMVLGYDQHGDLYAASSTPDEEVILDLLREAEEEVRMAIRESDEVSIDLALSVVDDLDVDFD